MANQTSTQILDKISPSIPVRIKPDGSLSLPKSWVRAFSNTPALVTKIYDVLVITPQRSEPDWSIDEKNWKKFAPALRKTREKLFKERYPELYAQLKGKSRS